jgi:histidinol phosphatase-like enzyme
MHILVLATKTEICNLDKCDARKHFRHTIIHAIREYEICVHISVLITKTNIC